jgi:D-alanyl-D-alanine carboxypeptidase
VALDYGLGIIVSHSWIAQNPSFAGYAAVMAYFPSKRITLAVTTTRGRHTPAAVNYAQLLARKISTYLAPSRPLILPG